MSCVGSGADGRGGDDVAPRDVDLVGESQRHRLRRERLVERTGSEVDAGDGRAPARGERDDLVAHPHDARGHLAGIPAVVDVRRVAGRALRADDELDRQPERLVRRVVRRRQALEQLEQAGTGVPGRARRALGDVVAVEGADGDRRRVDDAELARHGLHLGLDPLVGLLREVDEVDLVDRDDDVRHPQQRRDGEVAAGLLEHALAGVDEEHDDVGGRAAGDRVARVLHVPGAVGEHERAAWPWRSSGRRRRS